MYARENPGQYWINVQRNLPVCYCAETDIMLPQHLPILKERVQVLAQPGNVLEQEHIHLPFLHSDVELQQPLAVQGQAAAYVAGAADNV
jgi:hypothetical protein